jgi:hypothetical protein
MRLPYMEVSVNGGTPIAGWITMENPIYKLDDFEGTPIYIHSWKPPYVYVFKILHARTYRFKHQESILRGISFRTWDR